MFGETEEFWKKFSLTTLTKLNIIVGDEIKKKQQETLIAEELKTK